MSFWTRFKIYQVIFQNAKDSVSLHGMTKLENLKRILETTNTYSKLPHTLRVSSCHKHRHGIFFD